MLPVRRVGPRANAPHARPPHCFSACTQSPWAGALIALEPVASVLLVALRPLALRPVAPSAVFYSALLDAGPPCRTPPCRTFALLHAALGAYDTLDSAPSLSGSLDSAALLRSDSSHSNLRASSDSLECVPSAPRSKKLRRGLEPTSLGSSLLHANSSFA